MTFPEVGSILGGKYLVEGILGHGGMGVVVAARNRDLDQRVAIKCLLSDMQSMPEVVERFTREARAAARIQGEHVARVIDVGRHDDGTPFMVMEYLQGHDLAAELQQRGPLPLRDAVRYVLETCEAVVQAHAHRIVHRDLKPANLFLAEQPGRRPIVKVLDFGISKVIESGASALTKTASVMGTPYYMSPEQLLSSKNVDERSDIWALGVILYELLVGQPPFVADTAPEVVALVLQNAPLAASARRPDLPSDLDAVIGRCLRTKVEERYANVAALAHALMPFAGEEDRESIVAIARVLGVAIPEGAVLDPPAQPLPAASLRPASFAPAATAHNLSLSATRTNGLPRPRRGLAAIAGAIVAVGAAVGGVALLRPARVAPPLLGKAFDSSATMAPTPAPAAASSASLVALTPIDPGEFRPALPAPSGSAQLAATAVPRVPPRHAAAPVLPPAARSVAPAALVAPAPAAPPPPTIPALPQSNPLDMPIK